MKPISLQFTILLLIGINNINAQSVFYGLTSEGGVGGIGTISKYETGSNALTAAYTFPNLSLRPAQYGTPIKCADGKLYGLTYEGGSNNYGTIFSFDPISHTYNKRHDFDNFTNGRNPTGSLVQSTSGLLYGMTPEGGVSDYGTIFCFDPVNNTHINLHDFDGTDGRNPYGSLVQATDGKLYGMAWQGGSSNSGTIFSYNPSSNIFSKLYDFDFNNTNGKYPFGSLVQASDGKIYGTTTSGGSGNRGTIFSFDPVNITLTKLHDFDNTNGGNPHAGMVQAANGNLYGTTTTGGSNSNGDIFSFNPINNTYSKVHDFSIMTGAGTYSSLSSAANGKLYGMTFAGGTDNYGTIFSFDPTTNLHSKLHDFDNINGSFSYGSVLPDVNGELYGMTLGGGTGNHGTFFSFSTVGNTFTKLHDFNNIFGQSPNGSLVKGSNGKLYGMTSSGGTNNYGIIFSFDPISNSIVKLHDFDKANGTSPYGSLMLTPNGIFFGMTNSGGTNNYGTIFSFDAINNSIVKLHDFDNTNGASPYGSLMQTPDGMLFGMTNSGGTNNYGTIFSFDPITHTFTSLHDFDYTNGALPRGNLVQISDGKLYGMTTDGGTSGYGTIFSFDPINNTHSSLHNFITSANGRSPYGSLVLVEDGKLYGLTQGGGNNSVGTIFSFDPASNTHNKLRDFINSSGASPWGSLIQSTNGKLYGMTQKGGGSGNGVIFSFDPVNNGYIKLKDFNKTNGRYPLYGALIEVNTCSPTTEICDGVDNDCDGQIDEGVKTIFYFDNDGDGFGDAEVTTEACSAPTGYVSNNTDCDDNIAGINPNVTEICGNSIDENCNGNADDICPPVDTDGDGIPDISDNCPTTSNANQLDTDSDGQGNVCDSDDDNDGIADANDCDPLNAAIHPGAIEICGNGIDENCNGNTDDVCDIDSDGIPDAADNCPTISNGNQLDTDGDGQGNVCDNDDDNDGTTDANDCAPLNAAIHPGATEVCGNNIDDDCDGAIDEGCTVTNLPKITITGSLVTEGNSGMRNITFLFSLNKKSNTAITVQYQTANNTAIAPQDYVQKNGTVAFPANGLLQTLTIQVKGDVLNEINESFNVVLSNPVNATLNNTSAAGYILNDDPLPALRINDLTTTESSQQAVVKVTLVKPSGQVVTVKYDTKDGTAKSAGDYTAISNGSITFQPGETEKYIAVVIKQDNISESTEKFELRLKDAANATLSSDDGARKTATISIQNSAPLLTKGIANEQETDELIQIPGLLRRYQPLKITGVKGSVNELMIMDSRGVVIAKIDQYSNNWIPGNITPGLYFCRVGIKNMKGHYKMVTGKIMITD